LHLKLGIQLVTTRFRTRHFWLDWQTCGLPRVPATSQRPRICPTRSPKFLRHTGAGRFVWSSAVGD
jgi:hypothetical protein